MNEAITLLNAFGFTMRDAQAIAKRALENSLSLADIQAWIDEAQASTSLNNPLGFVRARLQDGDKLPDRSAADRHHTQRHRYVTQFTRPSANTSHNASPITRTGTCGHVAWADRICPDCGKCPKCCTCAPIDPDKE